MVCCVLFSISCSSSCFPMEHRLTHSPPACLLSWSYNLFSHGWISLSLTQKSCTLERTVPLQPTNPPAPPLLDSMLQLLKRHTHRQQSFFPSFTCSFSTSHQPLFVFFIFTLFQFVGLIPGCRDDCRGSRDGQKEVITCQD